MKREREKAVIQFLLNKNDWVKADILANIAGGKNRFFSARDTSTLSGIYKSIANSICVRKPNTIVILSRVL